MESYAGGKSVGGGGDSTRIGNSGRLDADVGSVRVRFIVGIVDRVGSVVEPTVGAAQGTWLYNMPPSPGATSTAQEFNSARSYGLLSKSHCFRSQDIHFMEEFGETHT